MEMGEIYFPSFSERKLIAPDQLLLEMKLRKKYKNSLHESIKSGKVNDGLIAKHIFKFKTY
jgi:hypothetical protein